MKSFLNAWARGAGIFALLVCLSLVLAALSFISEIINGILPTGFSVLFLVIFGPPVIYWASQWLAPNLFAVRPWRRGIEPK